MDELTVTIKLTEPLLIGDVRPSPTGQIQTSMNYITGTVLRGAVGTRLARIGNHDQHIGKNVADCPFCRVFLTGTQPRFGPCYPVGSATSESRPIPATSRTCKHYPGFLKEEDAHGIRDILLLQWATEAILENLGELPEEYPFLCNWKKNKASDYCEADLDSVGPGFYEPSDFFQPRVRLQRFSRVGIDRQRHVAADELLYTLEVLSEEMNSGRPDSRGGMKPAPTIFKGRVWCDVEADLLASTLREVRQLGGDTSRGLGAVEIDRVERRSIPDSNLPLDKAQMLAAAVECGDFSSLSGKDNTDLISRIAQFNKKLREVADGLFNKHSAAVPAGSLFLSLDLLSDMVLGKNGIPIPLMPDVLAGAERIRAWSSTHTHGGWHTAARKMRRTYLAIDAGSVFLYELKRASEASVLINALDELAGIERRGFGLEIERGYGWIEICSPFHLEVESR